MEFSVYGIGIIPVIIALVELFKRAGVPNRWLPLLALALGIVAGFVYLAPGDPAKSVLVGIVMGLSAVGLFSGVKNTAEGGGNSDTK